MGETVQIVFIGRHNIWLIPSEVEQLALKRVNLDPKAILSGKKNPEVEYWNSKERVPEWREKWAQYANRALKVFLTQDMI